MKKNVFFLAAMFAVSAAVMTGCSNDLAGTQEIPNKGEVVIYSVSIPATKAADDVTRALTTSDNGATLTSAWNGETVYVYKVDAGTGNETSVGTLAPDANAVNTNLTGTLSIEGGFAVSDVLKLYYKHDKDAQDVYTGQDGTLETISNNFDYAQTPNADESGAVKVTVVAPAEIVGNVNILKTSAATFKHRQAVAKYSFVWNETPLTISSLKISATGLNGGEPLTITPAESIVDKSTLFVALHNATGSAQDYTFNVTTTEGLKYSGTVNFNVEDGKYYNPSAALSLKKSAEHLTIEAIDDQVYTTAAITPVPVVKDGEAVLVRGTDYEENITYENNTNVGIATLTITGKGKYAGTKSQTFNIVKATPEITIAGLTNSPNGTDQYVFIDHPGTFNVAANATVTLGGTIDGDEYASSVPAKATITSAGLVTSVEAGTTVITVKTEATDNLNVATKTFYVFVREATSGDISQQGAPLHW